jgi:hypothetical protein
VTTLEDVSSRVSYIEGRLDSLATKADLLELKAELRGDLLKVVVGLGSMQLLGLTAVAAIMRFLG